MKSQLLILLTGKPSKPLWFEGRPKSRSVSFAAGWPSDISLGNKVNSNKQRLQILEFKANNQFYNNKLYHASKVIPTHFIDASAVH